MKPLTILAIFLLTAFAAAAQSSSKLAAKPNPKQKIQTVEASCGQCMFGMKGGGCSLAVRINGKAMFVDGTKLDDHGDAHAADGFCQAIRKAKVQGKVVNSRFKASYFKLEPTEEPVKD